MTYLPRANEPVEPHVEDLEEPPYERIPDDKYEGGISPESDPPPAAPTTKKK